MVVTVCIDKATAAVAMFAASVGATGESSRSRRRKAMSMRSGRQSGGAEPSCPDCERSMA